MIKAIVWDIGGVLVDNPKLRNFWHDKKGSRELRTKFGTGRITKKEFIKKGSKLLGINEKEFLKKYEKIYFSIDVIQQGFNVYKNIKIDSYILSNTNPIHGEFLKKKLPQLFKIAKKSFFIL